MEIICSHDICTGCGACNDVCPHSAITMELDNNGFLFPVVNQEKCVDCKLCQITCPILHPNRIRANELKDIEVREGWSLVDNIRKDSSSGGIFGQIAYDLLSTGKWKIAGVDFDGHHAYHKLISTIEELKELQNTKYVQSFTSDIFQDVLKALKEGTNVLFSGTPCQVGGLYSFLYKKKIKGELLTIEVVCHGVPTYKILEQSIEYNKADSIVSFRNKDKGWGYHSQQMEYRLKNNEIVTKNREKDLFYHYFFGKKKLRTSCHMCPYAKFPRTADITIGDSWGTPNPSEEERRKGLSLVIANNEKAKDFLENEANIHLRKIGWFTEIEINRNLYTPFPPIEKENIQEYLENIKKELDIPADEYLKNTPLGYIEKPLKIDLVHKVMRKIVNKALPRLEGNGELDKFSSLRFAMTILLLRLKTNTYTLPSQRYLSKKFIKLTKDVYNSKKA